MNRPWDAVDGECACGKRRYPTERVALSAMRGIRKVRAGQGKRPRRVYQCTQCSGWHLTSQSKSVMKAWVEHLGRAS